ncbi:MAG: hypothetical protein ACRCU3_08345 [Eubacteriaceae bacterium]
MKKQKVEKIISLPENVKPSYSFVYQLKGEEAYETFLLLAKKWNAKIRWIIGIFLTIVASVMLVLNFLDNRKVHYFFIAIIAVLLLFYLIYSPILKAKRGTRKVMKQKGTYRVKITNQGKIVLSQTEAMDLSGDKDARAIETETVFAIRVDGVNTVCIPKRIMEKEEIFGIREILKAYLKYQSR